MPYHDSPSPARRPQLTERSSSSHSLSRASPSTGKGSTAKLHKPHAVGHGRHPHGRIPSYGRNLNKLTKLTAAQAQEDFNRGKDHGKTRTQTSSTSPSIPDTKEDSSNLHLARNGSKVSIKRNASNLSQKRNKSASKLGNLTKPEKPQRKSTEKSKPNIPQFSVGSDNEDEDEDEDDGWTEADSSQSPVTTRRGSIVDRQIRSREPVSPDGPPLRSPTKLPASPPQSPPTTEPGEADRSEKQRPEAGRTYSSAPDAEVVTNRLLKRNTSSNAKPQTSVISATITPSGSSGSPAFDFGQDATLRHDQSMPSDGISRFLHATSSSSGNATPASLSNLNAALAGIHRDHERQDKEADVPSARHITSTDRPHQARSTPNLRSSKQSQSASSRSSSPTNPLSQQASFGSAGPSPLATRGKVRHRTQEKLNLQREATNREPAHPPAVQPLASSTHPSVTNLSLNSHEVSINELKAWEWNRADAEYDNARRFLGLMGKGLGRLDKQRILSGVKEGREERDGGRKLEKEAALSTSAESRPESRGRVRFEIGRSPGDEDIDGDVDSEDGSLEALLRRMWEGDGQSGGED
ncbi:MAG: hypothetical protein LQ346_002467 [Caloplaca aetnensis]|nr:MAG: hypothetical protein LQ346_002467 [Caloplaca aetnensis]